MTTWTQRVKLIGPGILVAATGVGAGDLATGAFTGSQLGIAILWAVLVGALLKFVLNEGLARWQLASGTTLLEGCLAHLGFLFPWLFLAYLIFWTFFVSGALMSATGVVAHAIFPIMETAKDDKVLYGILHSLVAVVLVWRGGYRLFEKVMSVCIAVMFMTVLVTAAGMRPDVFEFIQGMTIPTIPQLNQGGLEWTVALLGGIGGTLTIVCYGYWIKEEGRTSPDDLATCRIDLASGYLMTAIFGIAMVIIGSQVDIPKGKSAGIIVQLSQQIGPLFDSWGTWMSGLFLLGAWGAVFSSLLGVWQCVPYLFTDVYQALESRYTGKDPKPVQTNSLPYRGYLVAMATLPMLTLFQEFSTLQKAYGIFGALIIPLLSLILLILNRWIPDQSMKHPWWSMALLVISLLFSLSMVILKLNG